MFGLEMKLYILFYKEQYKTAGLGLNNIIPRSEVSILENWENCEALSHYNQLRFLLVMPTSLPKILLLFISHLSVQ